MTVELPLDQMSVEEKLDLIDRIWENLAVNRDDLPPPAWHEEVLAECRRRAESGEEKFIPWEEAKKDILRKIDEGRNPGIRPSTTH